MAKFPSNVLQHLVHTYVMSFYTASLQCPGFKKIHAGDLQRMSQLKFWIITLPVSDVLQQGFSKCMLNIGQQWCSKGTSMNATQNLGIIFHILFELGTPPA